MSAIKDDEFIKAVIDADMESETTAVLVSTSGGTGSINHISQHMHTWGAAASGVMREDEYIDHKEVQIPVTMTQLTADEVVNALPTFIVEILKRNNGVYLAGGALRSMIDVTPVNDYDFFFKDEATFNKLVQSMDSHERVIHLAHTPNKKLITYAYNGIRFQLVGIRFFRNATELMNDFDITACCFSLHFDRKEFPGPFKNHESGTWKYFDPGFNDARHKQIKFNNIRYPGTMIERIAKYKEKGYRITSKSFKEFFNTISESDELLNNMKIDWTK